MAQLSKIISSILRDMVVAQHEANMYAMTLSEAYKKNGRTELFPMPGVALGEIELDFKYGIKDTDSLIEQYEINYPEVRSIVKTIAKQLSRVVLDRTIENFNSSNMDRFDSQSTNMISKLDLNSSLNNDFCSFLSHRLFKNLQSSFTNIICDNGSINKDILQRNANRMIEQEIMNHKELQETLNIRGKTGRQELETDLKASVADILPKLVKDINLKRKRLVPSVDVIVSSAELAKLPKECIQSFRIKISPRDLAVNQLDNEDDAI